MTKLIIQIPCYNEEETLSTVLAALPRKISGIDEIEILVVNDGSTDNTVEVARRHGVDHIVDLPVNQGLARAFMLGIQRSLAEGADIIVNTDADNQYFADDIETILAPIIEKRAEIVIGARPIAETEHFSRTKKALERLGSWAVRVLSGTTIPDAPSGFRAMTRQAAMQLNVFSDYTYTMETIIQAGRLNIPICSVPIRTNPDTRRSRLVKSIPVYVLKSTITMIRIFLIYKPLRSFFILGSVPFAFGFLIGIRWIVLFIAEPARSHVPSLILASTLLLSGFMLWILGLIGELLSANRRLLEDIQLENRRAIYTRPRRDHPS